MHASIAWILAAVVLTTVPATAQDWPDRRLDVHVVAKVVPGTGYELVVGASQIDTERVAPKRALVAAVAKWVASETGLPLPADLPRVAFVTPRAMVALRYRHVASVSADDTGSGERPALYAIYDDADRTIYLGRTWTGRTRAEVSALVHEMVHHLQNVAKQRFACRGEREKAAYAAQERWLAMFGGDLERDFRIDPMTRLVRTACVL